MPLAVRRLLSVVALLAAGLFPLTVPAAAQAPPTWRDTGLRSLSRCFDATQPGVFYTSEYTGNTTDSPRVSYANNYRTGQRTLIASQGFDACNVTTGALFMLNTDGETALRFSAINPLGVVVAHFPSHMAPLSTGGAIYYSLGGVYSYNTGNASPVKIKPAAPGHLFVTANGGETWEERGAQFSGTIIQVVLTGSDAAALYALTFNDDQTWTVRFSADAGMTWEERATGTDTYSPIYGRTGGRALLAVPGKAAPVATIGMVVAPPGVGPHVPRDVQLSADGGRTFISVGTNLYGTTGPDSSVTLHATSAGILRSEGRYGTYTLSLSTDGGSTFAPVLTFGPAASGSVQAMTGIAVGGEIAVAPAAPNIVLRYGASGSPLSLSRDGGQTWEPAGAARDGLVIAPTTPPVALGYDRGRVVALDLPAAP